MEGTDEEANLLRETERGRLRTINVDDFDPSELVQSVQNEQKEKPKRKPRAPKAT